MTRLTEIYEGWKNVIFPTPEIEALAKERIQVCVGCEHLNILNICSKCCCPHIGKAHSPESRCPENKWKDGWGGEPQKPDIISQNPEIKIMICNDQDNVWAEEIYAEDLKFKRRNIPNEIIIQPKNVL
jgi:hypothetical protein